VAAELVEKHVEPVRDLFAAVFFVSVGMLIDPRLIWAHAGTVLALTAVVVVGKLVGVSVGAFVAGYGVPTAVQTALSLGQIGEFSFIIAGVGLSLGVTRSFLYPVAVAVSALTTLLTPYLIRWADPLAHRLVQATPGGFRRILHMYTEWLQGLRFDGDRAVIAAMVRRILLQAFVNFCLVAAIFGGGAYLASSRALDLSAWIANRAIEHALIWGAALLVSLPFLIAAYRKLKALSMMLAEVSVRGSGRRSQAARRIVAEVLPLVTTAAMLLLVSALSSSILPPAELLVAVLVGSALVLALLWRTLVKLHSRLQIALLETIQSEKDAR